MLVESHVKLIKGWILCDKHIIYMYRETPRMQELDFEVNKHKFMGSLIYFNLKKK